MRDMIIGIGVIVGYIVITAIILALPIMLLWNWLMPEIFNLPTITFWQALGISLLSSCLFKNGRTKNND